MATATNTNTPAEPAPEPYHRGEGRPPTPDEQGLVQVPAPEGLTERQQRGADCVFCRHELVTGHVTNLGPRSLIPWQDGARDGFMHHPSREGHGT